jgi:hypothetical protein
VYSAKSLWIQCYVIRTLPVLLLRTERPQIEVITTATAEKCLQPEAGNLKFCETFVPVYQIARRRISSVRSSSVRCLPMLDWEGRRCNGRGLHVFGIHWFLFWSRLALQCCSGGCIRLHVVNSRLMGEWWSERIWKEAVLAYSTKHPII